jgi:hypothetical protein
MVLEDDDTGRDGSIGGPSGSSSSSSSSSAPSGVAGSIDSERERQLEAKRDMQSDWWWWERSGKCCYRMGLLREAELRYKSSLERQVSPFLLPLLFHNPVPVSLSRSSL